ncbi:MAG: FAD:protein FMN transferase [Desulfamplus sp.]|nr:FAD:protein FMN transferase [Desulfamplus sp.]
MHKSTFDALNGIRFLLFIHLIIFHLLMLIAFTGNIYADDNDTSSNYPDYLEPTLFVGKTMGTTYHIKVVGKNREWTDLSKKALNALIEEKLKQVNQSMSVYLKNSEISLFNKADKKENIEISPGFYTVMLTAQKLYHITEGSWDGTVKPLVDLWGFGTKKEIHDIPSNKTIKAYLETTGFNQIIIGNKTTHTIEKKNRAVTLDLGSIAKGFGVDAIAQLLKDNGYINFLVEIGGEVFASGEKKAGKPWIVGISKPDKWATPDIIYRDFPLENMALATSGDYRNFITINGKSYSHIINPTTGYPVDNNVVSASVISDSCTFADGLATALMIMGQEKGIRLVNSLENVEALIVVREQMGGSGKSSGQYSSNAQFIDYRSKKFPLP